MEFSWARFVAAFFTVLVTTLDDSVWLVSFVGSSQRFDNQARWCHASTFTGTLIGLSVICCALALIIRRGAAVYGSRAELNSETMEIRLEIFAVVACWLLAFGFFVKKQLKKRRKARLRVGRQRQEETLEGGESIEYGAIAPRGQQGDQDTGEEEGTSRHEDDPIGSNAQPWTIVSLTTLGFLDEMSYFPTLILGNVFSVGELVLATAAAGLFMLGLQAFLSTQCKPFIEWVDRHSTLWGIVAAFAIVLTVHLLWDIHVLHNIIAESD